MSKITRLDSNYMLPRISYRLLCLFRSRSNHESMIGDYEEVFEYYCEQYGVTKARNWYRFQVLKSIPSFILNSIYWSIVMYKNYFKVTFRNIAKNKVYSFINITGLSVGIACSIMILSWVQYELSYDKYHENSNRIYRVIMNYNTGGETSSQVSTPSAVAPVLERRLPEVINSVRIYPPWRSVILSNGTQPFQEGRFYYAEPEIFDIFSFTFAVGDQYTALTAPNSVVITRTMAQKYFGDENPLGKTITRDNIRDFEVTGVIEDIPGNSHLQFDFVASLSSLTNSWLVEEVWNTANLLSYLLLSSENDLVSIEARLPDIISSEAGNSYREMEIRLQPITDIHLRSTFSVPGETNSNITYVYAFSIITLLIILIACINYMNLATARSMHRAREIGMRKVLGAFRGQLFRQFFGESAVMTFIAMLFSIVLIKLFLPFFNNAAGKSLEINFFSDPMAFFSIIGAGIFVCLIAGSYPAFFLSRYEPASMFKGTSTKKTGKSALRIRLVIFQFTASIVLIAATYIVKDQLSFVKNKNLGFNKNQVMILAIGDRTLQEQYTSLKAELLKNPNILSASAVSGYPGNQRAGYGAIGEGLEEGAMVLSYGLQADKDVVETLDLDLVAGNGFPQTYSPEQGYLYIINEVLMNKLGWDQNNAVCKWLDLQSNRRGTVVGVVKDFHIKSLHDNIEPLAMFIPQQVGAFSYLLLKTKLQDIRRTISFIEQQMNVFASHRPFEYSFLDQELDSLYKSEERAGQIFYSFSGLALLISSLGLFGLASFSAEQRTKEIGIRKVLGASVFGVLFLQLKEYLKFVVIAFIIALPITYFSMNFWLQNFAYRIDINYVTFLIAGGISLLIALSAVSYYVIRTAFANPVEALRHE